MRETLMAIFTLGPLLILAAIGLTFWVADKVGSRFGWRGYD